MEHQALAQPLFDSASFETFSIQAFLQDSKVQRIEELEYPEPALREAVLNAIVHKNYGGTTIQLSVYDDELILWNPGSLPPDLKIEILKEKHPSHPRNKNIADIFFKAGYIEA
ncbi:MAG TPA: ATP-binding protein [Chitinophagaceae bacterium]|nr:ATP-binding protein [Chitinophagaceae bacterium]